MGPFTVGARMGSPEPYAYRHFRAPNGRVYGINQLE